MNARTVRSETVQEDENHVSLKKYLERRFDDLERHIDTKFKYQTETDHELDKRICYLENTKIPAVEQAVNEITRKSMWIAGFVAAIAAFGSAILTHMLGKI